MSQLLVIGPKEQEMIKEHIAYAEAHPFDVNQLRAIANGIAMPPGNRPGFKIVLPHKFCVVFTVGVLQSGPYKQISISVEQVQGRPNLPSPEAVEAIIKEYGFTRPLKENLVHIEMGYAVNVVHQTQKHESEFRRYPERSERS